MQVKCPRCGQPAEYTPANIYRPFCSERCQTIDLGAWADERYRVPTDEPGEPPSPGDPAAHDDPPKHRRN